MPEWANVSQLITCFPFELYFDGPPFLQFQGRKLPRATILNEKWNQATRKAPQVPLGLLLTLFLGLS